MIGWDPIRPPPRRTRSVTLYANWPLTKRQTYLVLMALLSFWSGARCAGQRNTSPLPPPAEGVDTIQVVPEAFQAAVGGLVLENRGLRARLEGVRVARPHTVLVTDTVLLSDTVILTLRVSGGIADVATTSGILGPDSVRESVLSRGIDLTDCDDGFGFSGGVWTCDPARFGHLSLFAAAEVSATPTFLRDSHYGPDPQWDLQAGVSWRPSFRSEWLFEAYGGVADSRVRFRGRRGLRLW